MKTLSVTLVALLACAGCDAARQVVEEPNRITLQDAMISTVQALNATYREARKPDNIVIGYYPCTMKATYTISATGTTANKLGASGTVGANGVALSANASRESELTGARGNVVEVVFASSYCLPDAGGGGAADAAKGATRSGGKDKDKPVSSMPPQDRAKPPIQLFGQPTQLRGIAE